MALSLLPRVTCHVTDWLLCCPQIRARALRALADSFNPSSSTTAAASLEWLKVTLGRCPFGGRPNAAMQRTDLTRGRCAPACLVMVAHAYSRAGSKFSTSLQPALQNLLYMDSADEAAQTVIRHGFAVGTEGTSQRCALLVKVGNLLLGWHAAMEPLLAHEACGADELGHRHTLSVVVPRHDDLVAA